MSIILWHWLCKLRYCFFYSTLILPFLFYNTRFREGQQMMQSNNSNKGGEAASTFGHFPSGCWGQLCEWRIISRAGTSFNSFYSRHFLHASKRRREELYVAIATSQYRDVGGGHLTPKLHSFSSIIFSNHRRRLFFGDVFLYTFREGRKGQRCYCCCC